MTASTRGGDELRVYHHFVPKLLLRHFTDAYGCVTVYDRRADWASFRHVPERVGGEKYLYSPGVESSPGVNPKDDSTERWFEREIDGPAGIVLRRIVEGAEIADLTREEFGAIAAFVGMQDIRVPKSAELLIPAFEMAARSGVMDTDEALQALNKREIMVTREEVIRVQKEVGEKIVEQFAKPSWLAFLIENKLRAALHVSGKLWFIIQAPEHATFLTSDLAIAKFRGGFERPHGHSFGDFGGLSHWVMPLSPGRALGLAPFGSEPPPNTEAFVLLVNQQLVRDARRFVYSRELRKVGGLV
jgi:hypothetical protein